MATIISTDNEILVDKVITASRVKKTFEMEGFGRDLVPYFVPGAMQLDEASVNINTDVDGHRRYQRTFPSSFSAFLSCSSFLSYLSCSRSSLNVHIFLFTETVEVF